MNRNGKYYIVVSEWLYPTESGRLLIDDFDTKDEALKNAREAVELERATFSESCKTDPTAVNQYTDGTNDGFLITAKNGLDEWWFAAKVIEVTYALGIMNIKRFD
jgi:hypothetical protein